MNTDQRNGQVLLEQACDAVDEILDVYLDGFDEDQKGSLYEARRLLGNVLEELEEDPDNPDMTA
jgi:hypothetical protein